MSQGPGPQAAKALAIVLVDGFRLARELWDGRREQREELIPRVEGFINKAVELVQIADEQDYESRSKGATKSRFNFD